MASDTGAPWNLPYPEDSDFVRDGALDIEALAVATAAGLTDAFTVKNVYYAQATAVQSFSSTSTSFVDVTGLSITLTPKSATSKFLLETVVYGGSTFANSRSGMKARLMADSTELRVTRNRTTSSDGNEGIWAILVAHEHAPGSASPITYKTQATQDQTGSALTVNINRVEVNTDFRAASYLKITEFE
jgi:hypothetical protein